MDRLIKLKHQKLRAIRNQIFNTFYARDVDIFKPLTNPGGDYVLEDEDDFEEADPVTTTRQEDLPISYGFLDTTKAIRCKLDENGETTFVRAGESNDYDPDKTYNFLIRDPDIQNLYSTTIIYT